MGPKVKMAELMQTEVDPLQLLGGCHTSVAFSCSVTE